MSEIAQRKAVLEAANWWFRDAPGIGEVGVLAQAAVDRLGRFFRELRYSDKPTESSLASFSVDRNRLSEQARTVLDASAAWLLLIPSPGGQRQRNARGVDSSYQLAGILSPRWDLPVARRGVTPLSSEEGEAIFAGDDVALDQAIGVRLARLNAPFRLAARRTPRSDAQLGLF